MSTSAAAGQGAARVRSAWRAMAGEQRLAAVAAFGLLASMFLPWYEKNAVVRGGRSFASDSVSAFGALTFIEAAIFLVAVGVLVMLFARAERKPFHLPGGDGTVIMAAGAWAALLIFYRVFDRPDVSGSAGTVGVQWGFFVAFVAAGGLAYAGSRVRAAHRPEPPLPGEQRPREPGTAVTRPLPAEAPPAARPAPPAQPAADTVDPTGLIPPAPRDERERRRRSTTPDPPTDRLF